MSDSPFSPISAGIKRLFTHPDTAHLTFTPTNADSESSLTTDVAANLITRYIGLSRHDSPGAGLLFVHPLELSHSYVMRNMSFPIDILFLAKDGSVDTVHSNASPETTRNPFAYTKYTGTGKYVLETPAGWADSHQITVGTPYTIAFE